MFLIAVGIVGEVIAIVIGVAGLAGVIFTALRFRRDDTTAVVTQQSTILNDMKALNGELRETAESLRSERDALREQVSNLSGQVEALRVELREASRGLSGQVTAIQEKLDDDAT